MGGTTFLLIAIPPRKRHETSCFHVFLGCIEMKHWPEMMVDLAGKFIIDSEN